MIMLNAKTKLDSRNKEGILSNQTFYSTTTTTKIILIKDTITVKILCR